MPADARRAIEEAARTSWGRLLAHLAAGTRDLAAAEDALAEAYLAAVRSRPASGSRTAPRRGCSPRHAAR